MDQVEKGVTFGSLQVPGIATGMVASPLPADLFNLKVLAEYAADDLPFWAAQGDWVCILLGGLVPCVLRPRNRTIHGPPNTMRESPDCEFIGECYTPDFMHGQVMDVVGRKDFSYIDFSLR